MHKVVAGTGHHDNVGHREGPYTPVGGGSTLHGVIDSVEYGDLAVCEPVGVLVGLDTRLGDEGRPEVERDRFETG